VSKAHITKNLSPVRSAVKFSLPVFLLVVCISEWLVGQQNLSQPLLAGSPDYALLTYTQRYFDNDNNPVEYSGTLYSKVESATLSECKLTLNILLQDRFTGTESKLKHFKVIKSRIAPDLSTFRYSYQLSLKGTPDLQIDSVLARPTQLLKGTGFVCQEDTACRLQWLHLKASQPKFREIRTVDGLTDFDQWVSEISIPMPSRESATQSEKYLL
jgi:hypothetical protein